LLPSPQLHACLRRVHISTAPLLNNALHHAEQRGEDLGPDWIDPCSSAIWFDGWHTPIEDSMLFDEKLRELFETPSPVAKARTWLLAVGWRKHGLLRIGEKPATGVSRARRKKANVQNDG
jgi:hypothetical protein